ncbi:GroES-like protein [Aspergillus eucalypticola CBS 122712]|uniref:GroES-like protein n=1 Tax=Aspergillus eucalypticola (strain CBS 122712 / IBT 29274) TaxID=1448314 RepID=A0A317UYK0_ASPEC|nr:GroES-like protein [Aspergillus eucalypticola CBS 122712]PWY65060.1 GroES-like protein [Aspergillus eucalypticola CBS 122712]
MVEFTVFQGSESGKVVEARAERPDPTDKEVLVRITHSGLCGTDEHYKHAKIVLGHEGAGVVEAIGSKVTSLKIGDRVGWGYGHGSCRQCKYCLRGEELYCNQREIYGESNLDQGSFAHAAVWPEDFLYKIPDELSNAEAAPLMCAGSAVFSPLHKFNVRPIERVGVIGVGGLGHLAIQFAAKMGCEVVVLSTTESKRAEAMRLGASEFHAFKTAPPAMELLDHLLVTSGQQPNWESIFQIMAPGGTIYALTVDMGEINFPYLPLVMKALRIQGSLPAARGSQQEMLRFAARQLVKPIVMTFPLTTSGIEEAMETLRQGKMRYRGVLVHGV